MTKKFKLVKYFPKSPPIGTILIERTDHYSNLRGGFVYEKQEVESSTEFFAPYWTNTNDNVELYVEDTFYYISKIDSSICQGVARLTNQDGYNIFSIKEAAQKYIDLKPKYNIGEWLCFENNILTSIGRFQKLEGDYIYLSEYYRIHTPTREFQWEGYGQDNYRLPVSDLKPITSEIIEEILTIVATHKGFKEGIEYESPMTKMTWQVPKGIFCYSQEKDGLYDSNGYIYYNKTWATIVKNNIPEYVELLPGWYNKLTGKIFKTSEFHPDIKWNVYNNWEFLLSHDTHKYFFETATKEQYDAQFKPLPYINTRISENQAVVTIDNGIFTSVTLEDKQVKIDYQIK